MFSGKIIWKIDLQLSTDRITDIKPSLQTFVTAKENEISNHFNNLFGVTIFDGFHLKKLYLRRQPN
ncbi:MAG: hypothetical protein IPL23_15515 [Saprospiraceae bacterium]|nr:hypothetical protein [Saprospiraceae bacterium]